MALKVTRTVKETFLDLATTSNEQPYKFNHILEPEFHQKIYVDACESAAAASNSFRLGDCKHLMFGPSRGTQPRYADDDNEPESLSFEGMIATDGSIVPPSHAENICALKSGAIRWGFIEPALARSVSRGFYDKNKARSGVRKDDLLINSTGDGTIGRVAVYNFDFPAVVDGHVTILRFDDANLSWYIAAYLLSVEGQRQIFRYINGSSGQVEIYPQDIARLWIRGTSARKINDVATNFRQACRKHAQFSQELRAVLSSSTLNNGAASKRKR